MQRKKGNSNQKQVNAVQNLSLKYAIKTPQQKISRKTRAKYECNPKLEDLIYRANLVKDGYRLSVDDAFKQVSIYKPLFSVWYEFYKTLPKELKLLLFTGEDYINIEKQDSYEYWLNFDGIAQDKITDLNSDDEISDELFDRLINSGSDVIADYLVEHGYYGDEYSYRNEIKERAKDSYYSSDYSDEDVEFSDKYYWIERVGTYIRILERLNNIRDFLLAIINLSSNLKIVSNKIEKEEFFTRRTLEEFNRKVKKELEAQKLKEQVMATAITVDEEGKIHFLISEWAEILQDVDITRLRLCEVCQNIFWAKRKDAFACSKKHAKVRQMRQLRENWKEKGNLYLNARQKKAKIKKEK